MKINSIKPNAQNRVPPAAVPATPTLSAPRNVLTTSPQPVANPTPASAPTLSAEASASNARTAQALVKTTDHSAIKPHIQNALKTGGAKAQLEVQDLTQQMDKLKPGAGTKLAKDVGLNASNNITISGVPDGAAISAGTDNGNGKIANAEDKKVVIPQIPKNKTAFFKGREKEWSDFYKSTGKLGIGEQERAAYMGIFGQEGGMKKDPGGSAASGITQKTLNGMIKNGKVSGIKVGTPPSALSVDQRTKFYKAYMDEKLHAVGGSKALNQLPDRHAAQTLADTLYRQGQDGAAVSIQQAAKRIDPSLQMGNDKFGPQTFKAYKTLTSDPKMRDRFYKALAEARWQYAQDKFGGPTGDKIRADYFGIRR